jgi:hypothetical protein
LERRQLIYCVVDELKKSPESLRLARLRQVNNGVSRIHKANGRNTWSHKNRKVQIRILGRLGSSNFTRMSMSSNQHNDPRLILSEKAKIAVDVAVLPVSTDPALIPQSWRNMHLKDKA